MRSKAFIISTIITLTLVIGGIILSSVLGNRAPEATPVAVVGSAPAAIAGVETLEITEVAYRAEGEELVRSGDVEAAIVADDSAVGFSLIALDVYRGITRERTLREPRGGTARSGRQRRRACAF